MKQCILMYIRCSVYGMHNEFLRHDYRELGVYHFQDMPRIGETITISGTSYSVVKIKHEFLQVSTSDNISSENKTIVYLK